MYYYLSRDKSAVLWREWLGLVCGFLWFFGSMYSYYEPLFEGAWTELLFMLLLCAGLLGVALFYKKHPVCMEKALPYITLAGAACTGLIPFLPLFASKALFWVSALLMTPLLCRRLYGVLLCAGETIRIRVYISAVAMTIILQMILTLASLPFAVKFPLLSLFALLGLWRVQARLPVHKRAPLPQPAAARSPLQIARIAVIFLLLVLLNQFNLLIHDFVLRGSIQSGDLFSLFSWLLAPTAFLFFAYLTDKDRERLGFSVGMALIFIGCFAALTPANAVLAAPLLLTGEFGGTITEFCFLTMPLLFFPFSKRPLLVAVSGLIAHTLLSSAVGWVQELWLPQELLQNEISRPLIIFGAGCVMALIPVAFSVWRRKEDVALMTALLGWKKQTEKAADLTDGSAVAAPATQSPAEDQNWIHALDLLEDEHRIASLLCEGLTRAEISERLHMSVAQVFLHLRHIREKLDAKPPVGHSAYVQKSARRYGLTGREAEVFNELLFGRSNTEISANLYIEDATVKTHVHNILRKAGMNNRAELIAKARAEGEDRLTAK